MRRFAIGLFLGALGLLVPAAAGWACTNLSSLNLSAANGQPGTVVNVSGTSFATKGGSEVVLRWDRLDGPVLATTQVDPAGTIHASFTVPADAASGPHVILAIQTYTDSKGVTTAAYGTPARR